jgi:hypothetical protein
MQNLIISTALAIVLFLCLYLGFRAGLRLGMQTVKGQIPPKLRPIQAAKEAIVKPKPDPQAAELLRGWQNMQDYDGFLPEERQVT